MAKPYHVLYGYRFAQNFHNVTFIPKMNVPNFFCNCLLSFNLVFLAAVFQTSKDDSFVLKFLLKFDRTSFITRRKVAEWYFLSGNECWQNFVQIFVIVQSSLLYCSFLKFCIRVFESL